jgi:uncharacterized protein (DUF2336 family)
VIVHQFLQWVQTAPAGERADATGALARAYLYGDLDSDDRDAAEAAMIAMLDDPSPLVRETLALTLAPSPYAPHPVIHGLAQDQGDIAALVLAQSPVLTEGELVDAIGAGDWRAQCAVACRAQVPISLSAAIVETAGPDAALALLQNPGAHVTSRILLRIAERHGADAEVRAELLARDDCPAPVRHAAVAALSGSLSDYVARCGWLTDARAQRVATEAVDRATVTIAGTSQDAEILALVGHLRLSGRLTAGLILRALLSGNIRFFEAALSDLSGVPLDRVAGFVHARRSTGFEACYKRAGLPNKALPAFLAALEAWQEDGFWDEAGHDARLSRRMTERVLTVVGALDPIETEELLVLLRRFSAEAARDEARSMVEAMNGQRLIAA